MPPKVLTPQQVAYKAKAKAIFEFKKDLNKANVEAAKKLRDKNPAYNDLGVILNPTVFIKRKPGNVGITKIYYALTDKIATDRTGIKKQIEILNEVRKELNTPNIPNSIWQRKLSRPVMKKINERLQMNMVKPPNIKNCKSLSDIKKLVLAGIKSKLAVQKYTPKIEVSRQFLVIDGKTYNVEPKFSKGKQYLGIRLIVGKKRTYLRLDAIVTLLQKK